MATPAAGARPTVATDRTRLIEPSMVPDDVIS